jgi:hypothetical protein
MRNVGKTPAIVFEKVASKENDPKAELTLLPCPSHKTPKREGEKEGVENSP